MSVVVLGINAVYHDSSAAIVVDGQLAALAEEERLNRVKHSKAAALGKTRELPLGAIKACLARSGLTWNDITHVAYSFDPAITRSQISEPLNANSWGTAEGDAIFWSDVEQAPDDLGRAFDVDVADRFRWVPHEVSHAASAYYPSGFEDAAVLSLDGIGERSCGLLGHGVGAELKVLEEVSYPHSIGFLWEKVSQFLGLSEYEAAKTMALAAYGDTGWFTDEFTKLAQVTGDGMTVDVARAAFRSPEFIGLEELFGPRRAPRGYHDARDAGVAAALQDATERAVLSLASRLRDQTGSSRLCLAGGVALNCVANGKLALSGMFDQIFVQPLAHDGGTSWGAALHVTHAVEGVSDRDEMISPYLGPSYSDNDVRQALAAQGLSAVELVDGPGTVAELVANGYIGGWFTGAAEVGPRALGARSIVADPRRPGSRELINLRVKRREHFRPFAPSVLAEHADDWFEVGNGSAAAAFMSFALPVRESRRHQVPAVLHVDGTSRLQAVDARTNPSYHAMISAFHERTGVPLVLNTSFNTYDEPIVLSPEHAIATFLRTGLDFLYLQGLLVSRVPFVDAGRKYDPIVGHDTAW